MPRFFDVDREVDQMGTGMRNDLERPVGQIVQWYGFDTVTKDPLFEEGERTWKPPKPVPTMGIERVEGEEVVTPEGQYTEDTIHFNCRAGALVDAGIFDVFNGQRHINDRVLWDEFVWDVRHYQLAGRVMTIETVIGVEAVRVHPDELVGDPQFVSGSVLIRSLSQWTVRELSQRTIRAVGG